MAHNAVIFSRGRPIGEITKNDAHYLIQAVNNYPPLLKAVKVAMRPLRKYTKHPRLGELLLSVVKEAEK